MAALGGVHLGRGGSSYRDHERAVVYSSEEQEETVAQVQAEV